MLLHRNYINVYYSWNTYSPVYTKMRFFLFSLCCFPSPDIGGYNKKRKFVIYLNLWRQGREKNEVSYCYMLLLEKNFKTCDNLTKHKTHFPQSDHCNSQKIVKLNSLVRYATWIFSFRGKWFFSISNNIFFSFLSVQLEKLPKQNQRYKKIRNFTFYHFSALMVSSNLKRCLDLNTH